MSELYFRLGEMKGFTAIDLADRKEGYANPIRELLQNSLDASREAGNKKCEINIYIDEIPLADIPHIDEYKKALDKAIQTAKTHGGYNANSQQLVKSIKTALNKKNVKILMFSDNGFGMPPDRLEAILTGFSHKGKDDRKAGGSFGVGHLSSYSLSALRYVLYATRYKDDTGAVQTLFTGQPILAGYQDGGAQRGNTGRIVKDNPANEKNPEFVYPADVPDFIAPGMEKLNSGTMVVVLGLSEHWDEEAEYAIVSNFFYAIAYGAMSVTVHQNGTSETISHDKVERLINGKRDNKRARGENILSGQAVWQAWRTVNERNSQESIKLGNSDEVYVCIKSDTTANSAIILIRNGMVVARHDSMLSNDMNSLRTDPCFKPFTAVIDVDQEHAPQLFELVKGAEGPYHNKLQGNTIDQEDKKSLKKLFEELSEKIKDHLDEITRESFVLPLFLSPRKTEAQAGGTNKSSGQNEKAQQQKKREKPPRAKDSEEGDGQKRPKPVVITRNLKAKNAVRYTEADGKWNVKLRVIPGTVDDKDDVYLSVCLGEDSDKEEAKTYLDFIAIALNGRAIKIPADNKSHINLGDLKQEQSYNITAEVKKPAHIGDMKVALLPILGLKQRKPAKKEESCRTI